MATRATPPSTLTQRSSPRPSPPWATPATRRWPPTSSSTCSATRSPRPVTPMTKSMTNPTRRRRQRLWHRPFPRAPRRRRHRFEVQDPRADRGRRPFHQGPLRRQRGRRHRHLPQRRHRQDHASPPWRHGLLQRGLPRLPTARPVHDLNEGAHHRHQCTRRGAGTGSGPPTRSGRRADYRATCPEGRTQAGPSHAPSPRRTTSTRPRHRARRRRLQVARRRGQPGTPWCPRSPMECHGVVRWTT